MMKIMHLYIDDEDKRLTDLRTAYGAKENISLQVTSLLDEERDPYTVRVYVTELAELGRGFARVVGLVEESVRKPRWEGLKLIGTVHDGPSGMSGPARLIS